MITEGSVVLTLIVSFVISLVVIILYGRSIKDDSFKEIMNVDSELDSESKIEDPDIKIICK